MRALKGLFVVIGLVCFGVACRAALGRVEGLAMPDRPALMIAAAALAAGLLLAARAWVVLLRAQAAPADLVRGFVLSQIGKYIPGSVWLGAGQVGLAVAAGATVGRAAGALSVLGVCLVVAAGVASGALGLVVVGASPLGIALGAAGAALLLLLDRRWMAWLAARVGRRLARRAAPAVEIVVPSQPLILQVFGLGLGTVACSALAYAVLLTGLAPELPLIDVAAAFVVAWLAGYLVPGLPSGIGAREAVLVALLPIGAGPVVAASLAQRVVQMMVEATLVVATQVRISRRHVLWLPNAFTAVRIALVPVLWVLALRGSLTGVGIGLVAAGLTDLVDGWLARRLNASTPLGAKLDSIADNLIAPSAAAWVAMLRPDVVAAFWTPLYLMLSLYAAFLCIGWIRFRRVANLHLWSAKAGTALLYVFGVHTMLLPGFAAVAFWPAFAVTTLGLLEGLTMLLLRGQVDEHAVSLIGPPRRGRIRVVRRAIARRFYAGVPHRRAA